MTPSTDLPQQAFLPQQDLKQPNKKMPCLYVVATPIGNLGDMTPRAVSILHQVDVIAAEDTRQTQKLLQHYAISSPLLSLHEHNEQARSQQLIQRMQQGQQIALVSDAGTPLISDPGFTLVRQVRSADFPVVPVPGVSAVISALSVAGLATDRFYFVGFLPAKPHARKSLLEKLRPGTSTLVFYESPHRILASLEAMQETLGGERQVFLAREMTKRYETYIQTSLSELILQVREDTNQQRGELVLVVEGFQGEEASLAWQEATRWLAELVKEMPPSQASALVARMTGMKKKALYAWAIEQTTTGKG